MIWNMSKVIHYVKYINVWNQAEIDSVKDINDVKYKQDKPLYNEKSIGRHGYSYKQRKKPDTDNKQITAK